MKITLDSDEVINNCKFERLVDDRLTISTLSDEKAEIIVLLHEIKTLIVSRESTIVKYDFVGLSNDKRIEILNRSVIPIHISDSTKQSQLMSAYKKKQFQITLMLSALLILVIAIIILLKFKKKQAVQEGIPGVEEMAKTTFFWADWHRGKNRED
ncbi:hypothetical protein HQ531_06365 [bacterium]|nr:hypothetical protein [bacterium]